MADDLLGQLRAALGALHVDRTESSADDSDAAEVEERGETILCLYRHGKREQLRVVADEFCGQRFATIRVWFRDPDAREVYLPTGRGVTIRRREFAQVLVALHEIAKRLGVEVEAPVFSSPVKSPTIASRE